MITLNKTKMNIYTTIIPFTQEENKWYARPTPKIFRDIVKVGESRRYILTLPNGNSIAVGDILNDVDTYESYIEVPSWICNDFMEGRVRVRKCEEFPEPKRIVVKVIDKNVDVNGLEDFLEDPLSQLGILKEGQLLTVPILNILIQIEEIEVEEGQNKEDGVFLDGNNVALEIKTQIVEKKEEKPIVNEIKTETIQTTSSILPSSLIPTNKPSFTGTGYRLGNK
jgi:hypothetical protein